MNKFFNFLFLCGAGAALFYYGGWDILWNTKLGWLNLAMRDSIYIGDRSFIFRIDSGWYGVSSTARFFDSPLIQWAMLFGSFTAFSSALTILNSDKNSTSDAHKNQ